MNPKMDVIFGAYIGIENGNFFPVAGAAVPDEICEFVHAVGINMIVGYGLTESCATVSCFVNPGFEIGSVGTITVIDSLACDR